MASLLVLRKIVGPSILADPEKRIRSSAIWAVLERSSGLPLGIDLQAHPHWRLCQIVYGWDKVHPLGRDLFRELSPYTFQTRRDALIALERSFLIHRGLV